MCGDITTYDDAGKLLTVTEKVDHHSTITYSYGYDLMGNRTDYTITNECGKVLENHHYTYNDSNQLVTEEITYGKRTTSISFTYDADGNLISEVGRDGFAKVNTTYTYTVENRLEAVYDGRELLMAAAYDGDGNRVFQLNYDPADCDNYTGYDRFGCYGWYLHEGYGKTKDCGDDYNHGRTDKNSCGNGNRTAETQTAQLADDRSGNGNQSCNSSLNDGYGSAGCEDKNHTGNTCTGDNHGNYNCGNNHGNHCGNHHGNHCGVIFPIHDEVSDTEEYLYSLVRNHGCVENYELTEYINDVNREYTEVLVEQNVWGHAVSTYTYGVDRLSIDNCINVTGYYLYDPRGSVTGITNAKGQIYQSYRYNANGEITFGAPRYENEYTYNGESYNPNIESQYLRARYYNVTTAAFITEDSYLGDIAEPLTLNRYNYCVSNPLNYVDPSGNFGLLTTALIVTGVALAGGMTMEWYRSASQGDDFNAQAGLLNSLNLATTAAVGVATFAVSGGNPIITATATGATFNGFNEMNQATLQGKNFDEVALAGLEGAIKGGITGTVAGGVGTATFNALCAAGMPMWAVMTVEGMAASVAGGTTSRLLNGMEVNAETIFIDAYLGGLTALTMYGVANVVNRVIASKMSANTSVADDAALANQMSQVDDCDNALGTYTAPSGGGGITSTINVNGKTINFGHGGRHLTDLNVNTVNNALATEVSTIHPGTGLFYKGQIVIDGITIEYTSYGVADGVINIGTYYPLP